MKFVGVNIGALTVKLVVIEGTKTDARVVPHQGRPLEVLEQWLAGLRPGGDVFFGVSGHLGHISGASAIQRGLQELGGDYDAIASLGGESFLIYFLRDGKISTVLSHNKCAAGSGEFFVQQIGRMGLELDDAIACSFYGKVVPLAARCSVHCKSDITHKLNRKEATAEDILHTLHDSMAGKVLALLEKGQCELRRVLLIGGVSRNAAMLAALRDKRPSTKFFVLPESPWFEAWGSALLTRDKPRFNAPQIAAQGRPDHLPPLSRYSDQVDVIAAPLAQAPPAGPMVMGVDAGSTTTKAVLIDPASQGVVASYYTRTKGDPVVATRECLRALAGQIGNRNIGLIGTTGSARELAGAYLGTEHVYNEISAHAAGAAHFDSEVDTIFEIGGQDSKYIYLRNGVPIDYAMNNACSAGTGSFLEESAHGDLGIEVADIAGLALAARAPVQFKATCAAFINSDIRIALQQGQAREDIVAGLTYAIAANYLNRVKGARYVGKKVFLQGGVALNRAIGNAFAHSVGRQVVIPPSPELLGALGVALLALQRANQPMADGTALLSLAELEMERVSRFTCGACKLYCSIDHFVVGGRRFPFGGRCSLYENVWKRKARATATADWVELRREIIFGRAKQAADTTKNTIGIPKALTTHSLYPLYAGFFENLGMEVVLSEVEPGGELKANAGFCFPAQIAHGATLDLAQRGIELIFLPHVVRMPQCDSANESYLCPITQASPYYLGKAFPKVRILSPLLDFSQGYGASAALVEMAVHNLGSPRVVAEQAWAAAVAAQTQAEEKIHALGRAALDQTMAADKPAILLAGHSYNAFTPEASQSVGKKLASMGITAIPADCLSAQGEAATSWHFANQIWQAVQTAKQQPNLFLLCVSNFSCTIDGFTQSLIVSEMGAKPYLILEIDAHTADAGVQTRLEAFLDIVSNYRAGDARPSAPFIPARLSPAGQVIRASGEQVALGDPRVQLYFLNFSQYHTEAFGLAARWLGLHPGKFAPLSRDQLDSGLRYTTGRECLPLPICIGQLLEIYQARRPGVITGFYMLQGGAPCVVDAYMGYFKRFISEQRLEDVFLFNPQADNNYLGFDPVMLARHISPAIVIADIMVEIEHVLQVVSEPAVVDRMNREWRQLIESSPSLDQFQIALPKFIAFLAALPRRRDPSICPRVVVLGDFFTRFSAFFMEGVRAEYAKHGIILKPVDLNELSLYVAYDSLAGTANRWGVSPGAMALAKACTHIFQPEGKQYVQEWLAFQKLQQVESYYRGLFDETGLLVAGPNVIAEIFAKGAEHVSPAIYGEIIPALGRGIVAGREGYNGVIVVGPFNCLPFRISEAILKPLSIRHGMPILTYESDGYAVAPSFLRQVEVHIQQVLDHNAQTHQRAAS